MMMVSYGEGRLRVAPSRNKGNRMAHGRKLKHTQPISEAELRDKLIRLLLRAQREPDLMESIALLGAAIRLAAQHGYYFDGRIPRLVEWLKNGNPPAQANAQRVQQSECGESSYEGQYCS